MASTTVVHVNVEALTKFGYKANGKFVNYSKQLSESDKARVVPGASFEAEYYVSDGGKEYLNKIIGTGVPKPQPAVASKPVTDVNPPEDQKQPTTFKPSFKKAEAPSNTMSKDEWKAKDRSQLIGGLSHDSAEIVAAMIHVQSLDVETALNVYADILKGMMKIREALQ